VLAFGMGFWDGFFRRGCGCFVETSVVREAWNPFVEVCVDSCYR